VVLWVLAAQVSRLLCLQLAGILHAAASGALQPAVQSSHSVRSILIVPCLVIVAPCRVPEPANHHSFPGTHLHAALSLLHYVPACTCCSCTILATIQV